jgi:hypothetical protein
MGIAIEGEKKPLSALLSELNPEALLADGFEAAFIGIGQQFNRHLAVYDYDACVQILAQDMTEDEAIEYMEFNVVGAWVGENTPIFLHRHSEEDEG